MAAWDFVKEENNPFELAVINPALVIGPSLSGDIGESNKAIELVATGKMPVSSSNSIWIRRCKRCCCCAYTCDAKSK